MAISTKLFVWNAAASPPGAVYAACNIEAGNCRSVALDLSIANRSGFVRLNTMPLNAWPFRGAPVILFDDSKGLIS